MQRPQAPRIEMTEMQSQKSLVTTDESYQPARLLPLEATHEPFNLTKR